MTFVDWWRTINHVLRALGHAELLYGEARDFFHECHHTYLEPVVVQMRTRDEWADDLAMAVIEQERRDYK